VKSELVNRICIGLNIEKSDDFVKNYQQKCFTNSRRCDVSDAVRGRVDVAEEPGEERSSIPPNTGNLKIF
jgi:hypothetical protein